MSVDDDKNAEWEDSFGPDYEDDSEPKCHRCTAVVGWDAWHTCPFKTEINQCDSECNCCSDCQHQCEHDI